MTIEATTATYDAHDVEIVQCDNCEEMIALGALEAQGCCPECGYSNNAATTDKGIVHYKEITGRFKIYNENGEQIATADSRGDAERIVTALRRAGSFDALVDALQQAHAAATVQFHGDIKKESARVVAVIESALKLATANEEQQ